MSTTTDAAPARRGGQLALHIAFVAACLVTLFPLAWMLRTAFAPPKEVFHATLSLWPDNATVANFPAAFRLHPVGTWFVNSMIVSVGITAGKLVLSIPAAFAFGVLAFRGRDLAFALVVGTMTVPYVITLLPTYVAVASLGYYDTSGASSPSLQLLPRELRRPFDGAAVAPCFGLPNIGGCSRGHGGAAFLGAWNLYLWPHLILDATENKTLSIGLKLFATPRAPGPLMATALLAALPVVALYLVAQRQLISAFATSGVR